MSALYAHTSRSILSIYPHLIYRTRESEALGHRVSQPQQQQQHGSYIRPDLWRAVLYDPCTYKVQIGYRARPSPGLIIPRGLSSSRIALWCVTSVRPANVCTLGRTTLLIRTRTLRFSKLADAWEERGAETIAGLEVCLSREKLATALFDSFRAALLLR